MIDNERIQARLEQLERDLLLTAEIVARGVESFESDPIARLAVEALNSRVGEMAKRLTTLDPHRFAHPEWAQAVRNRNFVVHRYENISADVLWVTISRDFPLLLELVRAEQGDHQLD